MHVPTGPPLGSAKKTDPPLTRGTHLRVPILSDSSAFRRRAPLAGLQQHARREAARCGAHSPAASCRGELGRPSSGAVRCRHLWRLSHAGHGSGGAVYTEVRARCAFSASRTLKAARCRRRYGAAKEQFTHVVFLNLAQSVVCLCWSGLWLLVRPAPAGSAPGWLFWRVGLTNTLGPACGVLALKNIRRACQAL